MEPNPEDMMLFDFDDMSSHRPSRSQRRPRRPTRESLFATYDDSSPPAEAANSQRSPGHSSANNEANSGSRLLSSAPPAYDTHTFHPTGRGPSSDHANARRPQWPEPSQTDWWYDAPSPAPYVSAPDHHQPPIDRVPIHHQHGRQQQTLPDDPPEDSRDLLDQSAAREQAESWHYKPWSPPEDDPLSQRPTDSDGWQTYDPAELETTEPLLLDDDRNKAIFGDLSFLEDGRQTDARICFIDANKQSTDIDGLDFSLIESKAPALALRFKYAPCAIPAPSMIAVIRPRVHVAAVIGLLRGIYLSDYTFCATMLDKSLSLLFHLQVLHLAQACRADETEILANLMIEKELHSAVSRRSPVPDLCSAIRFLYTQMRQQRQLRLTIAEYCVRNFEAHHLVEAEAFRETAYQSPLFHQDLMYANMADSFNSKYAQFILQLPVCEDDDHRDRHDTSKCPGDFTCSSHLDSRFPDIIEKGKAPLVVPSEFQQVSSRPREPSEPGISHKVHFAKTEHNAQGSVMTLPLREGKSADPRSVEKGNAPVPQTRQEPQTDVGAQSAKENRPDSDWVLMGESEVESVKSDEDDGDQFAALDSLMGGRNTTSHESASAQDDTDSEWTLLDD